jgi:ABC-type sugar transport system ATPase subunit
MTSPQLEIAGAGADAGASASDRTLVLRTRQLDKWFGATHALAGVDVSVRRGDVHAIVGENGAGKSTLVKILAGAIPAGAYDGAVEIDGEARALSGIREAEAAGVFLVPQELVVVPETSVAENLFLNREPRTRFGMVDYRRLYGEAAHWIEDFGIGVEPTTPMRRLSAGQQQLVGIARAMTQGVKVLILDEPTSSLTDAEAERLFEHIGHFRARGVTTLYISHRLAEIVRLAQQITVMRDGRVVEAIPVADASTLPRRIVRSMVGRDIEQLYPPRDVDPGAVRFDVRGLHVANRRAELPPVLRGVDLALRRGEVVGVFGPVGSGSAELGPALFGALPAQTSGSVSLDGAPLELSSPRAAIAAGLGYVTADRKQSGLVLPMSIAENLTLVVLERLSARQLVDRRAELATARSYADALRIKSSSLQQPVGELSGGNQQKVVVAKWLAADPEVLILEEPTRGIDVGARIEIYNVVNRLAAAGKAILVISSDLPELIGICDRILVLNKGAIAGEWDRDEVTQELVMTAATGE